MSILTANIKLYSPFQKQSLIFKVFLFLEITFLLFSLVSLGQLVQNKPVPFSQIIISSMFFFFIGLIIANIQLDVLSKPFSFCLPSHHKIPRRIIFIIGITAALLSTIVAIIFFQASELKYLILVIPVITLTFYFFAVCMTFKFLSATKNKSFDFVTILIFIVAMISLFIQKRLFTPLNNAPQYGIILLLGSCILVTISAWRLLGITSLKRKCFENPSKLFIESNTGLLDQLHANNSRLSNHLLKPDTSDSRLAKIFNNRRVKSRFFSFKHSLMGILYFIFSRHFTLNGNEPVLKLILASSFLFFSGYLGGNNTKEYYDILISPAPLVALLPICMILSGLFAPSYHNLLLPEGRSRNFLLGFQLWLIKSVTLVTFISIVIAASWIIQDYIPAIEFNGYRLIYSHPGLHTIFWALIIMPLVDFLFGYVEVPFRLFTMVLLTSIVFILSIVSFTVNNMTVHAVLAVMMILITNGLFIILLVRYWFKRDHA